MDILYLASALVLFIAIVGLAAGCDTLGAHA